MWSPGTQGNNPVQEEKASGDLPGCSCYCCSRPGRGPLLCWPRQRAVPARIHGPSPSGAALYPPLPRSQSLAQAQALWTQSCHPLQGACVSVCACVTGRDQNYFPASYRDKTLAKVRANLLHSANSLQSQSNKVELHYIRKHSLNKIVLLYIERLVLPGSSTHVIFLESHLTQISLKNKTSRCIMYYSE